MRRLHQYFLCLLFAFSMLPAKAQRLDSLLKVLHSYKKEDTIKLSLLSFDYTKRKWRAAPAYEGSVVVLFTTLWDFPVRRHEKTSTISDRLKSA